MARVRTGRTGARVFWRVHVTCWAMCNRVFIQTGGMVHG
jgi:hypothetical protein